MFVGGEFSDDSRWAVQTPTLSTDGLDFLNGGRACLQVIADYLLASGISRVLLPSYLCPSILDVLDQKGLNYSFYQVNHDFSINLEHLDRQATGFKAIYFINYFGFYHSPETQNRFRDYQERSILIIEDNCQAGFVNWSIGDFVFNSMRKVCACDGGYMATRNDLNPFIQKYKGRTNHRLPLIRAYRSQLPVYLFGGQGRRSDLERLFYQAEAFYESDGVVVGDLLERQKIEHLDWLAIHNVRRENYRHLLDLIADIPILKPVFPALQKDNMPLGLPIYLNGLNRDNINETLADESISLTIHWDALLTDPRTNKNPLTLKMASSILTLPVDQYTSPEQLEYLADRLTRIISEA